MILYFFSLLWWLPWNWLLYWVHRVLTASVEMLVPGGPRQDWAQCWYSGVLWCQCHLCPPPSLPPSLHQHQHYTLDLGQTSEEQLNQFYRQELRGAITEPAILVFIARQVMMPLDSPCSESMVNLERNVEPDIILVQHLQRYHRANCPTKHTNKLPWPLLVFVQNSA